MPSLRPALHPSHTPHSGNDVNSSQLELLAAVLQDGMLCNDSNLDYDGKATYKPVGAPTEVALITGGLKAGLNVDELKRKHPRVGSVSSQ